jgi:hypothetical protein
MGSISAAECDELLRTFEHGWFRMEGRDGYAMDEELPEFERYLAGAPRPPSEIGWWQEWLDQAAAMTRDGKSLSRVRVIPDAGPTDYQRWLMWAGPWYARAGVNIRYITRSRALSIGLPADADWSLLDGRRVIIHEYNQAGEVTGWDLITDPGTVALYVRWQDTAVRNAALTASDRAT